MKISCTFFQHLGPQILSLMNTKNQPNGKKKNYFLTYCPFRMDFTAFKKFNCILSKQMHYMNIVTHRCMHYVSMKEN